MSKEDRENQRTIVLGLFENDPPLSRNEIAARPEVTVSDATVSRWAAEVGHVFKDRQRVAAATEALKADNDARLEAAIARHLDEHDAELDEKWVPVHRIEHTHDGTPYTWTEAFARPAERRAIAQTADLHLKTAMRLRDTMNARSTGTSEGRSLLEGIRKVAGALADMPDPDDCNL